MQELQLEALSDHGFLLGNHLLLVIKGKLMHAVFVTCVHCIENMAHHRGRSMKFGWMSMQVVIWEDP